MLDWATDEQGARRIDRELSGTTRYLMATMSTYGYRLMRAVLLDRAVFEEIEADRSALPQAIATVVLFSLAAGLGSGGAHGVSMQAFAAFSIAAIVSWALWSA